jgi:protein-disulfide isomerase
MKPRSVLFIIIGVLGVAALGYVLGLRGVGLTDDQRVAVRSMIEQAVQANHPAAPASPASDLSDGQRAAVTAMIDGALRAPPPPDATPVPGATQTAELNDDQRTEIEGIIRNFLIANPEIIRDAINELQRRDDEAAQVAQAKAISDNTELLFASADDVVLGNPKGTVTLVEFFDYNCAYCRRAHADMKQLIEKDPELRVILKEFPVLGDGSTKAAHVSMAVLMTAPDKYAAFHDALIAEPGQVDGERALAVAEEMGFDPEVLKAKTDSEEVKARIDQTYTLAGQLNLTGTPSYVTKKEVIVGAIGFEALKVKIDEARACATVSC